MQIANVLVALGGKRGETVPKYRVTPAELAVLQFLHGEDGVYDIDIQTDTVERTHRQEIERLRMSYSRRDGERVISPAINALFPGVGAQVPQKFSDLELNEELFVVTRRKRDPLDHDGDGKKGGSLSDDERAELGFAGMTVNELRAYADKKQIDITGLTRKADILEAVELHDKPADEAPADATDDNLFE